MSRYYNDGLRNNTSPALTWYDTVTAVRNETGPKGKPRKVATVDVTPARLVLPQNIALTRPLPHQQLPQACTTQRQALAVSAGS